jgi:nitrite reductase/ring-hydroxylating ferredoxin subunit
MRHTIIALDEIPERGLATAELFGREILIILLDGKPRAYVNTCMHHGGPLARTGNRFVCQWHGAQYDAKTGRALEGPVKADARLILLPVRVEDGYVTYHFEDHAPVAPTPTAGPA